MSNNNALCVGWCWDGWSRPTREPGLKLEVEARCAYTVILSPEAEYWLDWFHITMRITVMKQMARGLAAEVGTPAADGEPEKSNEKNGGVEKELQSLKWNLWHGNVDRAQERIADLQWELEITAGRTENGKKLLKQLREFEVCLRNNRDYIPNYGERYRNGERISTGFVESTVNQVVSKRMVKKQQMAWTERGAHLLLQVRTRVLKQGPRRRVPLLVPPVPTEIANSARRPQPNTRFLVVSLAVVFDLSASPRSKNSQSRI